MSLADNLILERVNMNLAHLILDNSTFNNG